jgi:hypothetical protein
MSTVHAPSTIMVCTYSIPDKPPKHGPCWLKPTKTVLQTVLHALWHAHMCRHSQGACVISPDMILVRRKRTAKQASDCGRMCTSIPCKPPEPEVQLATSSPDSMQPAALITMLYAILHHDCTVKAGLGQVKAWASQSCQAPHSRPGKASRNSQHLCRSWHCVVQTHMHHSCMRGPHGAISCGASQAWGAGGASEALPGSITSLQHTQQQPSAAGSDAGIAFGQTASRQSCSGHLAQACIKELAMHKPAPPSHQFGN